MKAALTYLVVFLLGGIAFLNLSILVGVSATYEASWFKVLLPLFFAGCWAYWNEQERGK